MSNTANSPKQMPVALLVIRAWNYINIILTLMTENAQDLVIKMSLILFFLLYEGCYIN